ncbi:hypothetical protein T439DRAFT_353126 [Meredithblackwellia eburnea MCA 4105]
MLPDITRTWRIPLLAVWAFIRVSKALMLTPTDYENNVLLGPPSLTECETVSFRCNPNATCTSSYLISAIDYNIILATAGSLSSPINWTVSVRAAPTDGIGNLDHTLFKKGQMSPGNTTTVGSVFNFTTTGNPFYRVTDIQMAFRYHPNGTGIRDTVQIATGGTLVNTYPPGTYIHNIQPSGVNLNGSSWTPSIDVIGNGSTAEWSAKVTNAVAASTPPPPSGSSP